MEQESNNYYKVHVAIHFLSHHVYNFVTKGLREYVEANTDQGCPPNDFWNAMKSVAREPNFVRIHNEVPRTDEEIAAIFSGRDGYSVVKKAIAIDPQKIFKILLNCNLFTNTDNEWMMVNKVKDIRNESSHQSTKNKMPRLEEEKVTLYFQHMLDLINLLYQKGLGNGEQLLQIFEKMKTASASVQETLRLVFNSGPLEGEDFTDMPDTFKPGFLCCLNEITKPQEKEKQSVPDQESSVEEQISQVVKDFRTLEDRINEQLKLIAKKVGQNAEGKKNTIMHFGDHATVNYLHKGASTSQATVKGSGTIGSKGLTERNLNKEPLKRKLKGDSGSEIDDVKKPKKKPVKRRSMANRNELIELKEMKCRPQKGKPFLAEVRKLQGLKKCKTGSNWTFHTLLRDKETSIDCRYYGEEKVCKDAYDELESFMPKTRIKVYNYEVFKKYTKKNKSDWMDGNHPRCRLQFGGGTFFDNNF